VRIDERTDGRTDGSDFTYTHFVHISRIAQTEVDVCAVEFYAVRSIASVLNI
jgi:hypothetical protein